MKRSILATAGLVLFLVGCAGNQAEEHQSMERKNMHDEEQMEHGGMGDMEGHMDHDDIPPLEASDGTQELLIPPLLKKKEGQDFDYEVVAQEGTTQFFESSQTKTYGYNGNLLGPTVRLKEGETVKVKVRNELKEPTTFHWHGLEIPGEADGGPNDEIQPGESKIVTLKADQSPATLWYHPHPHERTSEQVFKGLSGMLYIDSANQDSKDLPNHYGVDDIPLIFQDRLFDEDKQLDYAELMNDDGTIGDVSLVNGTMNPELKVTKPVMRFRMLNGSNARNYTLRLSNGATFKQIASDGGMLDKPVDMDEITLSPSERAEVLIDFSGVDSSENVAMTDEEDTVLLPFDVDLTNENEASNSFSQSWNSEKPFLTDEEKSLPVSKEIELFGMMDKVTINDKKFDPNRIDLKQKQGETEVWEVYNKPDEMGGMIHPFHIHGTQFKIISRDGEEPEPEEQGLKDNVLINPDERVKLLVTFPEKGVYMYHCHILEHEDHGMMGQVEVY